MRKRDIGLLALSVCAVDRIVKLLWGQTSMALIPGVLRLTPVRNTGISFGMFEDSGLIVALVTVAAVLCAALLVRRAALSGLAAVSVGMMLGGAAGNLIDRALYGYVIDMLEIEFFNFFVFNVADAALVCGAVLCGVSLFFRPKDWRRA